MAIDLTTPAPGGLPPEWADALRTRAEGVEALALRGLGYKVMFEMLRHQWWRDRQKLQRMEQSMARLMGVDLERRPYVQP